MQHERFHVSAMNLSQKRRKGSSNVYHVQNYTIFEIHVNE